MPYLYLVISAFCICTTGLFGGLYNQKTEGKKDPAHLYNLLILLTVLVGWWVMLLCNFSFDIKVLPYSIGFGVCYALASGCTIFALRTGPITLTSLFLQMSLIAVTIWGLFFWNGKITPLVIIGLVLVVVAITLCLWKGNKDEKGVSLKWLLFAFLAFAGNAGCTIIQRTEQIVFEKQHSEMLMAFSMLIAFAACLVLYLKSDKTDSVVIIKKGGIFPVLAAVFNIVLNLCVIALGNSELSPSLVYPTLAIGGLGLTTLFSVLLFKEKLKWWQWIGFGIGVVAIAILSI